LDVIQTISSNSFVGVDLGSKARVVAATYFSQQDLQHLGATATAGIFTACKGAAAA
jgi:hypothetical protein